MMIYEDKVNVKKARYIVNLKFKDFIDTFWCEDTSKSKEDVKTHYAKVFEYCLEVLDNVKDNQEYVILKRTYKYGKDSTNGRIYVRGGLGIQNFQGNVRKFLTEDYLLDIDIINAHPSILLKIVKDNDLSVPTFYLEQYVNNRDEIIKKNKFTKLELLENLNSDKCSSKNKFIKSFHIEKQTIFNYIIDETDLLTINNINSSNTKNPISALINKLFCFKENIIINSVMKHRTIIPMFDGFMFEKELKEEYDELLKSKDRYIRWCYKENKSNLNIDDWDEEVSLDYCKVKEQFEKHNCMIKEPLKFISRVRNKDGLFIDALYNEGDFSKLHKSKKILFGKSFLEKWYNDDKKLVYDGLDFSPYYKKELDKTKPYIYNLFDGFISKEIENPTTPIWFIDFISENIAVGDEDVRDYLINYIAHIFQHPDENPEVAIIIRGETGTGKDTLIEIIECLMGKTKDFIHRTADMSEVFPKKDGGGFNSALKNKLVLQLNEADGFDALKVKELIKDQITRKYNFIKEKYMKDTKQTNLVRIFFLSNQISPIAVEYNDRRLVMIKTGSKNKGNTEYWDEIYKKIYNQEIMNNLYTWLGGIDITKFDPNKRPLTEAYENAIQCNVPIHIKYLYKIFTSEYTPFEKHPKREEVYYIKIKRLYQEYQVYLTDNFILEQGKFKSLSFKRQLMEFKSIVVDKLLSISGNTQRVVMVNKVELLKELKKYQIKEEQPEIC